jgi:YYY domain-containing protein
MSESDHLPPVPDQPAEPQGQGPVAESPAPPAGPRPLRLSWKGLLVDLFLVALCALGITWRFNWVNWSQGADLHPDEYGLTSVLTELSIPKSLGDYFNTRLSPISPYQKYDLNGLPTNPGPNNRLPWGQWPLTLIRLGAEVTGNTDYGNLRLFGRQLSALADTLALLMLYLVGRRLHGHRVGLLAAALGALAVMEIQQSHFMTADTFALLFATTAMYGAVQVSQGGGWKWYVWFGVFGGMAVASRINVAVVFAEIVVAAVVAEFGPRRDGAPRRSLWDVFLLLALAGVVGGATFRVTQPMAFRATTGDTTLFTLTPNSDWVETMKASAAENNGINAGPPGEQWTNRPILVFPFINMVIWGMGLPLGLMAWAGILWAVWRVARSKNWTEWGLHVVPLTWVLGYFLFMGTRWVKSIRYFLTIYPFVILFAAWALVELWNLAAARRQTAADAPARGRGGSFGQRLRRHWLPPAALVLFAGVTLGTLAWAWGYTSIYRHDNSRIQASRWMYQNIPGPFNLQLATAAGPYVEALPAAYNLAVGADPPFRLEFRPHVAGVVTSFSIPHALGAGGNAALMHVVLAADPDGKQPLAQADLTVAPAGQDPRGSAASASLAPVTVDSSKSYFLFVTAPQGQPVVVAGATVANEEWDEGLPLRIDGRDAFGGLYRGLTMNVRWVDNQDKRQMYLNNLAQVDYIILPSQRGLWSTSRLANNYPMTLEYYRALFDGRLGFDLVAEFQSPIAIGPLQVSDAAGTWAWGRLPRLTPDANDPFNNNLLAAEEAFSVYDHAPVWIFRKRADFNLDQVRQFFNNIDLTHVVNQDARGATQAPTLLMLPPDQWATQRAGGTWSQMFNPEDWLNSVEPLGVLAWWLTLVVAGWLAFPLAYLALGTLPDRGYAFAKIVGLVAAAWLVWTAGSYYLLPFTRATVVLGFVVVAAASAAVYVLRRAEINAYVRRHWRHLLVVEGVFLALFLFDLLIRLGNPDLWHPVFGGEKPMVFSYFNAVLKSTYFPPYDPWLAGGYLNYYYYGWVIVGLPVKLLGIVPSFAYNLILPMLFALTGTGAFGAAYNLVATVHGQKAQAALRAADDIPAAPPPPNPEEQAAAPAATAAPPAAAPARRAARGPSAYLAGAAAALLIVVLGNLAQVGVVVNSLEKISSQPPQAMGDWSVTAFVQGATKVLKGETPIPMSTGNWYWDATRIVDSYAHQSEITEFPFFTFLYADLHAHMMDLPIEVLAVVWALACVLGAVRGRSRLESAAFWTLGGLALGVTRAVNTWDFPTYLTLGVVAVIAAQVWQGARPTRANLAALGGRLLLLVGLVIVLYHPYDQWFVAPLTNVEVFKGAKVPLEPYLAVYGLFLFLLATFLFWETRRWLAETPASVVTHAETWLYPVLLIVFVFLIGLGALLYLKLQAAWLAWPLMTWAGLLLWRSRATLSLEKRAVLFLIGTGLALTLFVDLFTVGGDRMNTIFKLYMQVWVLFSIAAAAALAWAWAEMPLWSPVWQTGWTAVLAVLVASAAFYTVTAASAKIRDRFPQYSAQPYGVTNPACQEIPTIPMPYKDNVSLAVADQPHSLDGLAYMTWSAYCDHTYFLPLTYDYDAIHWMQTHVTGSPVIAEAQSFDLYKLSSRYAWYTGLPDVVGWDYHQRQERGAVSTAFITERGQEVTNFYLSADPAVALNFVKKYDVRYIIVGPMEQAYYQDAGGLTKFETLASTGKLTVAYRNPGVTIYQVAAGN